jgi:hypothetical protein
MSANIRAKVEGFKQAWFASLHDPDGPSIKAFADIAGCSHSTLSKTADEECPDEWPSMRKFLAILPSLTDLSVLDYIAGVAKCAVFRIPDARYASGRDIGNTIKEFGEWVVAASEGEPSATRLARMEKEGREAMACIQGAIEAERMRLGANNDRKLQAVSGGQR